MVKDKKKLRLCPLQDKKVVCDGLCNVVFDDDVAHICSVRERALDVALNVDIGIFPASKLKL